jgi:hypothetical protein
VTQGEIDRMVEEVRSINDPAERAKRAQELQREAIDARKALAAIRTEAVRELRAARDAEHPDGWSHAQVAELLGVHRNNAQRIAEGRGQNADDEGPDAQE